MTLLIPKDRLIQWINEDIDNLKLQISDYGYNAECVRLTKQILDNIEYIIREYEY